MLADSSSAELSGWYEYSHRKDEHMVQIIARAIVLAFNGTDQTKGTPQRMPQQEEIIDTTDPEFARLFQGFTDGKQIPSQHQPQQQGGYEIIDG